jgi:hypothetical protein
LLSDGVVRLELLPRLRRKSLFFRSSAKERIPFKKALLLAKTKNSVS